MGPVTAPLGPSLTEERQLFGHLTALLLLVPSLSTELSH